ncbi:hypothetical protein L873DRAFT_1805593 [Choiromyces venosus 120613-1]|uniref:Uncharacterized protein n=1 Tax=Choiromyces venosus 120613-1 TaxID=1336337 RepID=A0A3N4JPC2_9PEZI|nr:hypothetical protein L873DRAFT_1805593 [Choiromyces venosus 120613-1]
MPLAGKLLYSTNNLLFLFLSLFLPRHVGLHVRIGMAGTAVISTRSPRLGDWQYTVVAEFREVTVGGTNMWYLYLFVGIVWTN